MVNEYSMRKIENELFHCLVPQLLKDKKTKNKKQRNHHLKAHPSVCVWDITLGSPRSKFEGTLLWVKHSKPWSLVGHLWAERRKCNAVEGQGNMAVCSPSRGQILPRERLRGDKMLSTCSEGGQGTFMPTFSSLHIAAYMQ